MIRQPAAVLVVAADVPWPPDGGGRIVSGQVLRAIAAERPVDLLAFADPAIPVDVEPLRAFCRSVELVPLAFTFRRHRTRQLAVAARALVGRDPYRLAKFRSRAMHAAVERRLAGGDHGLVHVEQLGAAPYRPRGVPATLTHHNIETQLYELAATHHGSRTTRAWSRLEARKMARAEVATCRTFDRVFTVSAGDAAWLAAHGVDRVTPLPLPVEIDPIGGPIPPAPRILSLGSMSWFGVEDGLLWFHDEVWPLIRARVPDVRWDLVGPHPSHRIRAFEADLAIRVHGYVDSVEPFLRAARLAVVPLRIAAGVRVKLLELMGRGRPAVATSLAAQGLLMADGAGCLRRDRPADFAAAVADLLTDDGLWATVVGDGLGFVGRHHTQAAFSSALAEPIRRLLGETPG